jgi:hypothetical protein
MYLVMDQWAFIEGAAKDLGVNPETVRKWRIRGVPGRYRLQIADAANAAGFNLDRTAFDMQPQCGKSAQSPGSSIRRGAGAAGEFAKSSLAVSSDSTKMD